MEYPVRMATVNWLSSAMLWCICLSPEKRVWEMVNKNNNNNIEPLYVRVENFFSTSDIESFIGNPFHRGS